MEYRAGFLPEEIETSWPIGSLIAGRVARHTSTQLEMEFQSPPPTSAAHPASGSTGGSLTQSEMLAELHAGLAQLGAAERTLLIVLGDHGEAFGDDGYHMHGGCIGLGCMRVPAVWHDPLGVLNDTDVGLSAVPWTRHADVAPTILRWAGYRLVEGAWQGTAVRPGVALGTNASVRARGARVPASLVAGGIAKDRACAAASAFWSLWDV